MNNGRQPHATALAVDSTLDRGLRWPPQLITATAAVTGAPRGLH